MKALPRPFVYLEKDLFTFPPQIPKISLRIIMDDPVLIRSLSILIENSPDAHFFRNIEPFIAERMPIPIKMTFGYR